MLIWHCHWYHHFSLDVSNWNVVWGIKQMLFGLDLLYFYHFLDITFNYFSKSKAYMIVTNTIRYLLSLHKKWVTFKTSAICWLLCWILFKKTKCNIFKRFSCENVYSKNVKKNSFKDIFVIVWNFFNLNSQTCANPTLSTYFPWSPW